uniref:Ribonuclease H protein At1g65750 family n=1 Tax=Cajanus cajan TaxID=3821 RepID=A0A151T057_CAJCA|nr:Putative ribonuclease H protein At1g65750 family [Cajanus cajan]
MVSFLSNQLFPLQVTITPSPSPQHSQVFKLIWKSPGPQQIRLLLWSLVHNALLTNENCSRRHMAQCNLYHVFQSQPKTMFHVLRDCPPTDLLLQKLLFKSHETFFGDMDIKHWILHHLDGYSIKRGSWNIAFSVMVDLIWRRENEFVFLDKLMGVELHHFN